MNSEIRTYGYNDPELVISSSPWSTKKVFSLLLAVFFIISVWLALDSKLLFGKAWLSETYDNEDWRTNEGNLHTYGAWDLEAHIWKTEYVLKNFPNFHWNPYWYLGMPLLKYYQSGFYAILSLIVIATNVSIARASLLLIIFSHLLATFLTFILCYKVSRKIWVSALSSSFVLSNTFITLRSYGWEPITVVFLFLYPLGLLLFLKEPLRPFRFWLILTLGISYLSHPLLWFSLCMTMMLYLLPISLKNKAEKNALHGHYILQLIGVIFCSLLIGAVQFLPQIAYQQATSGAHMGMKYLPYYQVPFNIITLQDFFLDAQNLKGPGPIIMISFFLLIFFFIVQYVKPTKYGNVIAKKMHNHELITGLAISLLTMVLFYYIELYNIFPMNFLRSIQYHRIIPEFVITGAVLVAALSNMPQTRAQKITFYSMLSAFVIASGLIVYLIQLHWVTTDRIDTKPEFIYDKIDGRISFPYTDQSLAVRNSFTEIPQAYGYYEQGITNAYNDEIFSVSSGFHNADLTIIYLKAANIGRLYVNLQEGERDKIVMSRLNQTLPFVKTNNSRYAYFDIKLANPSFAQAIDANKVAKVQELKVGCRTMFKEEYCGSIGEEFVSTDTEEVRYLSAYVSLLEEDYFASANMVMDDPNHYSIDVKNAYESTAIVVKMTYDKDFIATVNGKKVPIEPFGPDFMLISPKMRGDYTINLEYDLGPLYLTGVALSIGSLMLLGIYFLSRKHISFIHHPEFSKGDMNYPYIPKGDAK